MNWNASNIGLLLALPAVLLLAAACGEDAGSDQGSMNDTPTTKIRQVENVQIVFDLLEKQAHDNMMEMMGGEHAVHMHAEEGNAEHTMHESMSRSHFIMVTLMNAGQGGGTITDAQVNFTVSGPDGAQLAEGGHVMSGKGMHHHAVGFDASRAGFRSAPRGPP